MKPSSLSKLVAGRPVTLKSIAEQLGLSVTTVARSLKDGHKISAETVQRVRDTAEALGYVRNLDGLRLRTGRTLTLMAFLGTAENDQTGCAGPAGVLAGLHRRLGMTDYALRVVPVGTGAAALPAIRDAMRAHQADGFILDHVEPEDDRVAMLIDHDFPFVSFGRGAMADRHAWFDVDAVACAAQATRALVAQGFRRIALVEVPLSLSLGQQRAEGYRAALAEAGLTHDPALVLHHHADTRALRGAVADLCRETQPDAFVCAGESYLLATLAGLRDAGTRAVDRTGFAVRSATHMPDYLGIKVTASHFAAEQVGWELADMLLQRVEGAPLADLQRLVRPALHPLG